MLVAYGWAVVRSSREAYSKVNARERVDEIDDEVDQADQDLFDRVETFLSNFSPPELDWHFRRTMNNAKGTLLLSSSRNHRGDLPSAIAVFQWLSQQGPGSFGLVYVHDDEDDGRTRLDHRNEFRVWRLLGGKVSELTDPFLSPIVPNIDPNEFA
jgi:hypothetical protein